MAHHTQDCPRNLFFHHLSQFLEDRLQAQEQIIVMGDFNHVVDSDQMLNFLHQHQLHNIHKTLHPSYHTNRPTHSRGSQTIDAIFATPGITATKGGFLGFQVFPSDHRLVWCDIAFTTLFGHPPINITPATRRRLKCEDPRTVQKFCDTYMHLLNKFNAIAAVENLSASINGPLTTCQIKEYERLDRLRVHSMLLAERTCRKFKVGGVEFSPKLQYQRDRINLWKNVLSKKQGSKVSLSLLTRLEKKVGVSNTLAYSIQEIKNQLSDAYSTYKQLKKPANGADLRDEWFENLAAAKAAANKTSLATELKQQRQKEKQRQAFRAIRWTTKDTEHDLSISQIHETINGTTYLRTTKQEVEAAIISANDRKFRQTNDTPVMTDLLPDFGFLGSTTATQEILNGTYVPCTPIDAYSKAFIQELRKPPHIPMISTSYTAIDYASGWKKMREQTTSGLSGIHFGHHKACSQHSMLSHFESKMCAIPYQTGYAPLRYKRSLNAMLLKKHNKLEADQLRTILLLEADFNHLNKKLGRDLMYQAEKFNLIAPEQFGSRKSHSCIDQVLVKKLYYDVLRMSRMNGFLCSNDAKSCYDRIIHSVASIAMQRIGMPIEPIVSMFTALQDMQHYVKTAHGISTHTYGCRTHEGKPVQGSGQGNGASPTIWTLLSSPLLSMMRKLGFGVSLHSPLSKEHTRFVGCSFVDDTDLLQTGSSPNTPLYTTQHKMQQAIDAWSNGLRVTGGALVPHKSWIYPIQFSFDAKGQPHYCPIDQLHLDFTIADSNLRRCPLVQIHPSTAKETLGVFLAPDGNESTQITYLQEKITQWVDKVQTKHIARHHAQLALMSTIYKTIKYPLPALTISSNQWNKIMAPLVKCGLQNSGICSKLPRVLREGSKQHMALNIKNMYLTQEIFKLDKYLFFRNHPGLVGQMIRLSEELLLLETGISGNLYNEEYAFYHPITTESWSKSLWKFVSTHRIKIQMASPTLRHTKKDDVFLIPSFIQHGYKNSKLKMLNTCRKYLQVVTLGDITSANGTLILPNIKAGRPHTTSISQYNWPHQPTPDRKSWAIWRQALRRVFETRGRVSQQYVRSIWSSNPARTFQWYYHQTQDCIFHHLPPRQWQLFRPTIRPGRRPRYLTYHRTAVLLNSLPPNSTPTMIIPTAPHQVQQPGAGRNSPPTPLPPRESLYSFIQSTDPSYSWVTQSINGLHNLPHIVSSIRAGNCAMISDGSFCPAREQASCGWHIGNEALHRLISGSSVCTGPQGSHSAYRGELAGLYGGLFCIMKICEYEKIHEGRIIIGCDNIGALKMIQSTKVPLHSKHFDYVSSIHQVLQHIPINCQFVHVKGHQDSSIDFDHLSVVEKLNVLADTSAKQANHTNHDFSLTSNLSLYKEYGPIFLDSDTELTKIYSEFKQSIYSELTKDSTRSYWLNKFKIPKDQERNIEWEAASKAFMSLSSNKQNEVIKWNADFCGTGKNLKRWKEQMHSSCPICGVENEDTDHILRCPHPSAKDKWNTSLLHLSEWLHQRSTAPEIISIVIENLRSWHDSRPPVLYTGPHPHLSAAQLHQSKLGWGAFLRGFLSHHWIAAQSWYLDSIKSKKTGKRWLQCIIEKLWSVSWDQWRFRNGIVHSESNTTHTNFSFLLTSTIIGEMNCGHRLLPPKCNYLFASELSTILKGSINSKRLWLASVWAARDLYSPADLICQNRNPIVSAYIVAWRKKLKK